MLWLAGVTAMIVAGGLIAYKTGVDEEIYRTVMNFGAGIFVYVMAKVVDLFCWFLYFLPALPYSPDFVVAVTNLLTLLARANTFFPVVETCFMFGLTVAFLLVFISLKFVLKLIPTIG